MKILFVSHDASATGAPHSLLNFLDYVKLNSIFRFRILLLKGGELKESFERRGPALVVRQSLPEPQTQIGRFLRRIPKELSQKLVLVTMRWKPSTDEKRRVANFLYDFSPDLIFINSVAAAPIVAYLKSTAPVITYVRELHEFVQFAVRTGWFAALVDRTTLFIAVSAASKNYLVNRHKLDPRRFVIIPPFIDIGNLVKHSRSGSRKKLLELVGRTECSSIILGCGTTDSRKGPDLFVEVAKCFFGRSHRNNEVFIWIGGMSFAREANPIRQAIVRAGLADRVFFPGIQQNSAELIAGGDVFALTSREEPFGRVVLEAGIAEIPTICFRGCGGAEEFVAKGAGITVDPGDVQGFAAAIEQILTDQAMRVRLGKGAQQSVLADHDAVVSSKRIIGKIGDLVREREAAKNNGMGES